MVERLSGKAAIVTGASRGIGRATAVALGREGAAILLAARSLEGLKETAGEVRAAGGKAEIVQADLSEPDSARKIVDAAKGKWGRLDLLINNAGVTHSASLEETAVEDWDKCMAVNARGPFLLCKEALGLLRQGAGGLIINIGSVVSVKGYPRQSAYTASKHALRGMTMSLAQELRGSNVGVRLICTGGVDTEMVGRVRPDINKAELIWPDEIADLVVYLATHKGRGVVDEIHMRRASSSPWFVC